MGSFAENRGSFIVIRPSAPVQIGPLSALGLAFARRPATAKLVAAAKSAGASQKVGLGHPGILD